jgi:hypothetical protein
VAWYKPYKEIILSILAIVGGVTAALSYFVTQAQLSQDLRTLKCQFVYDLQKNLQPVRTASMFDGPIEWRRTLATQLTNQSYDEYKQIIVRLNADADDLESQRKQLFNTFTKALEEAKCSPGAN